MSLTRPPPIFAARRDHRVSPRTWRAPQPVASTTNHPHHSTHTTIMTRNVKPATMLLFGFLTACGAAPDATSPRELSPTIPAAGKTPSLATISLDVTISDVDDTGASYMIRSDGHGSYSNGAQNVAATISNTGVFQFDTFTGNARKASATRWVTYDFSAPVDPTNSYRPTPSNALNYHFSTGGTPISPTAPWIPLQNLGVNGNPSTECGYMGNGFSNSTTGWTVSFRKGAEETTTSPTSFVMFTRVSVSPAVWTVQASGWCTVNANVASLRTDDGVLRGYYSLPFLMTLRAR